MNAPPPYGQPQPPYAQPPYPRGPQPPGAPPPKKGMSGCVIALLVVGGLFVLGSAVFALFVWRFATSDEGKKIVSAVSSGAQLVSEAQSAPGTSELRGLGCAQAMVMDAEKLEQLAAPFGDAGAHAEIQGARLYVSCQASGAASAPTCEQVASTYARAVGGRAAADFAVKVTVGGGSHPRCEAMFDASGARKSK